MPLLSFVTDVPIESAAKREFSKGIALLYADHMETEPSHIAVEVREVEAGLWLGRADPETGHVFLDADVRAGRSQEQRRAFALAAIEQASATFSVPENNCKVVFTQHAGPEMMGANRVGSDWTPEDG